MQWSPTEMCLCVRPRKTGFAHRIWSWCALTASRVERAGSRPSDYLRLIDLEHKLTVSCVWFFVCKHVFVFLAWKTAPVQLPARPVGFKCEQTTPRIQGTVDARYSTREDAYQKGPYFFIWLSVASVLISLQTETSQWLLWISQGTADGWYRTHARPRAPSRRRDTTGGWVCVCK